MTGKRYHQAVAVLVIFLVFLNCFATGTSDSNQIKSRQKRNIICMLGLTGFLAEMFHEALEGLHKFDPVDIGTALDGKLSSGVFNGMKSLHNASAIDVHCEDDKVILSTLLEVTDASINYKWKQKLLFTFSGSVWTKVKEVQFDLKVTLNMAHGIKLDVTNLTLTKLGGLQFGFSGLGPLNPVIKIMGNVVMQIWSHQISDQIEKLLRNTLQTELSKLTIKF
ncbi:hypothetical protein CDAR_204601 [Caerostris darwini]|uniref:Uncharacterized protein n=1 Tax=Caerostris darwini TaxID=1538125 RepID=A0AAV4MNE8_9ARAC|nr:hypothetical protein CDAR_204601 [Caerostris darwini]